MERCTTSNRLHALQLCHKQHFSERGPNDAYEACTEGNSSKSDCKYSKYAVVFLDPKIRLERCQPGLIRAFSPKLVAQDKLQLSCVDKSRYFGHRHEAFRIEKEQLRALAERPESRHDAACLGGPHN